MVRSRRARRASLLEGLESRIVFNSTYKVLADGKLFQNWNNPILITANDDWSGVPSIIGYRGDDLTGLNSDPANVTAFAGPAANPVPVVDVNANQTSPNTFTTGGVTEFALTDPVVSLKPSDTADAPFLLFNINTTGQTAIPMSFRTRDLYTSTTTPLDSITRLGVQYRIGESGAFTPITLTTANGIPPTGSDYTAAGAGPDYNVSFTLPGAVENQSQVQIRIIVTNFSPGADEGVGIDDISIGSVAQQPIATFQTQTYSTVETDGNSTANITLTRDVTDVATTVNYTTAAGTASDGTDFIAGSGTATFAIGQATTTIPVTIVGDTVNETQETFTVTLTGVTGGLLGGPASATVTIADNDIPAPVGVLISETKINPASTADEPHEYIEIRGTPGQSLAGVYYVTLEGDTAGATGGTGVAEFVVDLSSITLPLTGNGLLLIKSPLYSPTVEIGTTVLDTPLLSASGGALENEGSVTHLLVFSANDFAVGTDYDTASSGTLGGAFTNATILDSFAFTDGSAGDRTYAVGGTTLAGEPDGVTRIVGNTTANSAAAFFAGDLLDPDSTSGSDNSESLIYDPATVTGAAPPRPILTPGAANDSTAAYAGLFYTAPLTVNEDVGTATVTVVRAGGTTGSVTVNYALAGGTATGGADYTTIAGGTLTFPDGVDTQTYTIPILEDTVAEIDENIRVQLTAPTGGAAIDSTGFQSVIIYRSDLVQPNVLLNEILSNAPGADQGKESLEILGTPGSSALFVYVITLEGDSGAGSPLGVADYVFNITSSPFGTNGLLLLKTSNTTTFPYPYAIDPASGVNTSTQLDASGGALENATNTFMVIYSPQSPIVLDTDYDTNDDGVLELPTGAVVLDAIAGSDGGAGDKTYGATIAATVTDTAAGYAFTRYNGNTTPNTAAAWFSGTLTAVGTTALNYNVIAAGGPSGNPAFTPGGPNAGGSGATDTLPPTVTASSFTFDTSAALPAVTVTFSESVTASLTTADFTVTNIGDPSTAGDDVTVPAANLLLTYTAGTNVATLRYTTDGTTPARFPDGNYTVTLTAGGVTDAAGNTLSGGNLTFNFFALGGDADRNRSVDTVDFARLIANFGTAGAKTFTQGDFNFDGTISSLDFNVLVASYGKTLPAVPAALPVPASTPFAQGKLVDDLDDLLG